MHLAEAVTLDRKSGEADLSRRAVEGSAVPRIFRGNVFLESATQWRNLRFLSALTQTLKHLGFLWRKHRIPALFATGVEP